MSSRGVFPLSITRLSVRHVTIIKKKYSRRAVERSTTSAPTPGNIYAFIFENESNGHVLPGEEYANENRQFRFAYRSPGNKVPLPYSSSYPLKITPGARVGGHPGGSTFDHATRRTNDNILATDLCVFSPCAVLTNASATKTYGGGETGPENC